MVPLHLLYRLGELGENELFTDNPKRVENHEALKVQVEEWSKRHKVEDIVKLLSDNRIPSCPIYDLKQASEDHHIADARGMVLDVEQPGLGSLKLQGNPIKMSMTDPKPRGPAPSLGGDNRDVLREILGYSDTEIERLKQEGII